MTQTDSVTDSSNWLFLPEPIKRISSYESFVRESDSTGLFVNQFVWIMKKNNDIDTFSDWFVSKIQTY